MVPAESDLFPRDLIRKIVPFVVFAVVVYLAVFFFGDARATVDQIGRISGRYLAVALQLAVGSFLVRALRWHYYLRITDLKVPIFDSLLIFLVGLVMSLTPGKVGEVLKSLLLKEAWQIPVARSAPILLAERITDLIAVLLLGAFGLLSIPHARIAAVVTFAAAFTLVVLCTIRRLGLLLIEQTARLRWVGHRREKLMTAYSSLTGILGLAPLAVALTLACIAWGLQSVCLWVIAGAFPGTHITLAGSLVASCAPILAGALALVPGGLGATEASMTGLLLGLGGPAMTASVAVAMTVCFRLVTFWLAIALGLVAFGVWRARHRLAAPRTLEGKG